MRMPLSGGGIPFAAALVGADSSDVSGRVIFQRTWPLTITDAHVGLTLRPVLPAVAVVVAAGPRRARRAGIGGK